MNLRKIKCKLNTRFDFCNDGSWGSVLGSPELCGDVTLAFVSFMQEDEEPVTCGSTLQN